MSFCVLLGVLATMRTIFCLGPMAAAVVPSWTETPAGVVAVNVACTVEPSSVLSPICAGNCCPPVGATRKPSGPGLPLMVMLIPMRLLLIDAFRGRAARRRAVRKR
jgi:hypothetical protein